MFQTKIPKKLNYSESSGSRCSCYCSSLSLRCWTCSCILYFKSLYFLFLFVCLPIYGILPLNFLVEIHYINQFFLPCLSLSPSPSLTPPLSVSITVQYFVWKTLSVCVNLCVCVRMWGVWGGGGLLLYCHTHHSTRCPICTSASSEWRDREKEGVRGCWCDGLQVQETRFGLGTRTVNNCSLLFGNIWIVTFVCFCSDIKMLILIERLHQSKHCIQGVRAQNRFFLC